LSSILREGVKAMKNKAKIRSQIYDILNKEGIDHKRIEELGIRKLLRELTTEVTPEQVNKVNRKQNNRPDTIRTWKEGDDSKK